MNKIEKISDDKKYYSEGEFVEDIIKKVNETIEVLNNLLSEPRTLKLSLDDAKKIKEELKNSKRELQPSQQKTEEPLPENTFTKGELEFISENLTSGDGTAYDSDVYHQLSIKIYKLLKEKEK